MRGFEVRGVPRALAKDAWWMVPEGPSGAIDGVPAKWAVPGAAIAGAVALVVLADLLIWAVAWPGVSLAVFAVAIAVAAASVLGRVQARAAWIAASGLILGLLPIVEQVGLLSLLFGVVGLAWALVWLALGSRAKASLWLRAMVRLPAAGVAQIWVDGAGAARATLGVRPGGRGLWALVQGWGLTVGLGAVFAALLVMGNPLLDVWLANLAATFSGAHLSPDRVVFWAVIAALVWPALRLTALRPTLEVPLGWQMPRGRAFGLFTPETVVRALVLFNAIFAVQTLTDATYLWGGVRLPEGLSYAAYAHRGAYPLLATALLAGLFALLTQPFWAGRPILRTLLAIWVAQNVLLVASSALRLELYVEVYGLTRLRFAAFVWMSLVAAGLALMLVQMARGQSVAWLMARSFGLAGVVLYGLCFFNIDGYVARHNLSQPALVLDYSYLCDLGAGAAPAIAEHLADGTAQPCSVPIVREPVDWREWGYRNARLRHSLAAVPPPKDTSVSAMERFYAPQGDAR
ncbi:DUF4153 domain-containing protein [Flavimaricola marinus]|uniref:Uncharacterized protein n=1 Tax=Flavimaricola marinus TaxID=1819565 RepID=A0A238L902_9RHOB|nr:DUF4173 domain-containing protein [Flavimaricola marinus]SMY06148.1 hypothetical protein LOM8899_00270 [Flavimaricola marinus]